MLRCSLKLNPQSVIRYQQFALWVKMSNKRVVVVHLGGDFQSLNNHMFHSCFINEADRTTFSTIGTIVINTITTLPTIIRLS